MDSVSDIGKDHFLCFVTNDHNLGQGHLQKSSKVKQKNRDLELWYMFVGQIFARHAKNDLTLARTGGLVQPPLPPEPFRR